VYNKGFLKYNYYILDTFLPDTLYLITHSLSRTRENVECAFGILNAKFKIFEGPMCCKEGAVNSAIKASLVLHNFITTWEGLFCEEAEKYAVNQSSHHILNEDGDDDDDGRQILSRVHRLRNQLADYFLTPAKAIPSHWSCLN
jgi:hypothetical protein